MRISLSAPLIAIAVAAAVAQVPGTPVAATAPATVAGPAAPPGSPAAVQAAAAQAAAITTLAPNQAAAAAQQAALAYPAAGGAALIKTTTVHPAVPAQAAAQTFNPMQAAASPQVPGTPAVAAALNAAIDGNSAELGAVAPAAIAEAPLASGQFVEGFIDSYFTQVTLEPGEKVCIERNAELMTQDSVGIITQLAVVIGQLVAKEAPNVMGLMTGAGQAVEIVTTTENLIKRCVRADAVAVMNSTLSHLKNPAYVKGRLLANGLEIAGKLADSIPAYEASDFQKVGGDFGALMRKVLLSSNSGVVNMVLPQGMAQSQVGEAIMNGIIQGMFVLGTTVNITSKVDPTIDIYVDLHRCIAQEAPYFTAAANAIYLAIAQLTSQIETWQLQQQGIETGYIAGQAANPLAANAGAIPSASAGAQLGVSPEMSWMNQLSGVMTNIPVLMLRCGFTEQQRQMLSRALKDMHSISLALTIPGPRNRIQAGDMAAAKFEDATKAWEAGNYQAFGELLGGLVRDLLLTIYPQNMPGVRLYDADHGQLRAFLGAKETATRSGAFVHSPVALTVLASGLIGLVVLGLSTVRRVRHSLQPAEEEQAHE